MNRCDVLIVGGGPAGSSCAWKLRQAGLDVTVMDRAMFPRNKVCGGWITPQVIVDAGIDFGDQLQLPLQPLELPDPESDEQSGQQHCRHADKGERPR